MNYISPDKLLTDDNWSDLRQLREMPDINLERMHEYRTGRIKEQMRRYDVDVLVMVNPLSMRYAVNFRSYAIFMMHVPSTYMFMSLEAPFLLHNGLDPNVPEANKRLGPPLSHFYGGPDLKEYAERFADDVDAYLIEAGASKRKVALEFVNPSVTQALEKRGIEVIDGMILVDEARIIKNEDEINCLRWSIAVAEHGASMVKKTLKPGVTEAQLWGLINYTNLANDGDWHEGRMLSSGPRTNPWLQEATQRVIQDGDLVGFDTDMVGPFGYCADLSRTFHCGPSKPTARQKELYQLAAAEVEHNLGLVKPGMKFSTFQQQAFPIPDEFKEQAYVCVMHGIGMCDEYPHLNQGYRDPIEFDSEIKEGMVLCIESYMGAVGERDGVKLEEQVLVTADGYEQLTTYPLEEELMS